VRNRIARGDKLEVIGPGMRSGVLRMDDLFLLGPGETIQEVEAVNPNQRILIRPPFSVECFDLLRREKNSAP